MFLHKTCFYTNAVFTQALSLHKHCFYTSPAFTQKRFYTRPAFTQTLSLHKRCLYTSTAFTQGLLLHKNVFTQDLLSHKRCLYTSSVFTQALLLYKPCFYTMTFAHTSLLQPATGNRLEGRRNVEGCKIDLYGYYSLFDLSLFQNGPQETKLATPEQTDGAQKTQARTRRQIVQGQRAGQIDGKPAPQISKCNQSLPEFGKKGSRRNWLSDFPKVQWIFHPSVWFWAVFEDDFQNFPFLLPVKRLKYPSWTISGINGICNEELHEHINHEEGVGDDIKNAHPREQVALQKSGFEGCKNGHQDQQTCTNGVPFPRYATRNF